MYLWAYPPYVGVQIEKKLKRNIKKPMVPELVKDIFDR